MNRISEIPMVSVIIPCRNEEMFIGQCLESIIRNDYPKDRLEILVVDGMSDDGTRAILESYAQNYSFISLLDNPKTITQMQTAEDRRHQREKTNVIFSLGHMGGGDQVGYAIRPQDAEQRPRAKR